MDFEYLGKDEATAVSLPPSLRQMGRDDFTFHGHRLSSLYRGIRVAHRAQTGVNAPSSFQKYSTGARGFETPAPPSDTGSNT